MPSPALIVGGVIIAVGAGFAFKQFVYDPYLAHRFHEFMEDFHEQREQRHRRPAEPHLASPSRGKSASVGPFSEKRRASDDGNDAGLATGTEMREVSSSNSLRRRGGPFQRNGSEVEMAVIGDTFPLTNFDKQATSAYRQQTETTARQEQLPPVMPTPPATRSTPTTSPRPAPTSPRSPFSDIHALSEISFDIHSSSDPFEDYQLSPPAMQSPPIAPAAAPFSPFVLPQSPPNMTDTFVNVQPRAQSPFVEVARSERPASPWSELSAHSGATTGQQQQQLHLRLSRTDSDSEKEGSESGSEGSWEHA
ncbi:hypothetical protein RSOLAG22IIIB_03282 [Rhizoctonia solani]|uniref:Uncharacterized protein n=1 Tax=Rhizoctonia solani TaxID=456999 RepID=A0A0K6FNS1_9AGAM|nr:hypothetical protein RSOLAG22IIIB_03282 [Rhizoctonia solani]